MKKISFKNLSNDEILTRDELKRIVGGDGSGGADNGSGPGKCHETTVQCTLTVQNTDGGWNTYYGNCSEGTSGCFCDIGQPVNIPITSNGGISRCTK